jgi:hypothetical protein
LTAAGEGVLEALPGAAERVEDDGIEVRSPVEIDKAADFNCTAFASSRQFEPLLEST